MGCCVVPLADRGFCLFGERERSVETALNRASANSFQSACADCKTDF